jgi:hypothetical protein
VELVIKTQLEQHYLDTIYSVLINEQQYNIKITEDVPSAIKEILELAKEKTAVILTAWNPKSKLLSSQENKERNKKLDLTLRNNDYPVFKALGKGDNLWPAEESFFIIGIKKEDAEQLAVEFGQNAFVWIDSEEPTSLIFTEIWHE